MFAPEMCIEVFSKVLLTLAINIVDEKTHPSIRVIRIFCHFHALFLLFLKKYPQLNKKMDQEIETFLKDPSSRVKDKTSNLGVLVSYFLVSDKYKVCDIAKPYFAE
jgi:hypothetical protein